jgi:hypothetical protein
MNRNLALRVGEKVLYLFAPAMKWLQIIVFIGIAVAILIP